MAIQLPRVSDRALDLVSDTLDSVSRGRAGGGAIKLPGSRRGGLVQLLPRVVTREGVTLEQHLREGRFQRSLALIAGVSGLLGGLEVSYEHYRGSYGQRVMYSPVVLSAGLAAAGIASVFNRRAARVALPLASVAMLADGVLGFFFHVRGINRKPGGWRIPVFNVIMGPPLFAPLLLGIGGFLGVIATFLRREDDPEAKLLAPVAKRRTGVRRFVPRWLARESVTLRQDVREGRFQRILAGATAASAILNGVESLYSHYKNNFRYGIQWTPILLSPVTAAVGFAAIWSKTVARTLLPLVSLLSLLDGGIGFFYHARGVARRSGGLRHWVYNVLYGPPIFAPLLYAATGFLGLLASLLRRD